MIIERDIKGNRTDVIVGIILSYIANYWSSYGMILILFIIISLSFLEKLNKLAVTCKKKEYSRLSE